MSRTSRDDLVVVRSSFFVGNTLVPSGEVWTADDRLVRSHPQAFRPLEVNASDPERAPRVRPSFPVRRPRATKKATAKA